MRVPNEHGDLGKYDDVTEKALHETHAVAVAMFVLGGSQGSGFSVAAISREAYTATLPQLADMLEFMAKNIREAVKGAVNS